MNTQLASPDVAARAGEQANRWVPAAGLTFVALLLLGFVASPSGVSSSDPATAIAGYYASHARADLVSDYLSLLAFPVLVWFLVGLARRLSPGSPVASAALVSLGVLAVGFELAATAIEISLASAIDRVASPPVVSAFYQLASRLYFVNLLLMGLAALCAVAAARSRRGLPSWVLLVGLLAGLVLAAGGLSAASPHGLLAVAVLPGEALFLLFVASTSLSLWRSRS